MKSYLLLLLLLITGNQAGAQYQRTKSETIDFVNSILKLREETTLYEPLPLSKSNPLILSQKLHAESYIQVKRTFDVKQTTTVIDRIKWDTLKAFGYNDNRSELYIYFNAKLTVNNSPSEVFSLYIPADRVEIVKNAILRLVEIVKAEK